MLKKDLKCSVEGLKQMIAKTFAANLDVTISNATWFKTFTFQKKYVSLWFLTWPLETFNTT